LSGRLNPQQQVNSVRRKQSSKVNLLVSSQEFGPFSKRRNMNNVEGASSGNIKAAKKE